ncbi:MAG: hypothetical protein ABI868_12325 [Acidobacteriota bacterium]
MDSRYGITAGSSPRSRTCFRRAGASRPIQLAVLTALLVSVAAASAAQSDQAAPEAHHHPAADTAGAWSWTADANAFFGYNYQQRKYADFSAWESQNWFMLGANRIAGAGRLTVEGMLSLEPFTMKAQGSPQLFQTGESYQRTPNVNFQHPHDLLMALGATYRLERPGVRYTFGADLVGSPTLGPTPFMHRESARNNPAVPIGHHSLDSTHITTGVLRFGVETGPLSFEASTFRGAEPDEDRLNVERPALDSWAVRVGWHRGPWQAQVSGGRLHEPEWFEPYDVTRLTASIGFSGAIASRALEATAAWGQNREFNGYDNKDDSFLLEWDFRATGATSVYGRAEQSAKQIFGLGLHPRGFTHPHFYSQVSAVTVGAVRDLPMVGPGRVGVGSDVTFYPVMRDVLDLYQGSHSFHVFLRWRPAQTAVHVH